jgi:predicted alpha/beta hydrolase family esterase
MRQVLFVQGGGEGAHDEWDIRLVDSLRRELGSYYEIRYPHMPNEAEPKYGRWKAALQREFAELGEGVILVGHSIGGTVLINALATDPPKRQLGAIFLVAAPFIGAKGWPSDEIKPRSNLGADLPKGVPIYIYHGLADETAPVAHVDLYASAVPQAIIRRLKDRNHQLNDDLSEVAHDIHSLS